MLLFLGGVLQGRNAVRRWGGICGLPYNIFIPLSDIPLIVFLSDNVLLPAVVDQFRFRQLRLLDQEGLFAMHESDD